MILLGVNQTILFALSMVVIAGLIGGGGLGDVVTSGPVLEPGAGDPGGVAIVIMAMALDRSTEAAADRTDPGAAPPRRRADGGGCASQTLAVVAAIAVAVVLAKALGAAAIYPDESATTARPQEWLLARVQVVARLRPGPVDVRLLDHRAHRELHPRQSCSSRCRSSSSRRPGSSTVAGLTAIAFVVSGCAPR